MRLPERPTPVLRTPVPRTPVPRTPVAHLRHSFFPEACRPLSPFLHLDCQRLQGTHRFPPERRPRAHSIFFVATTTPTSTCPDRLGWLLVTANAYLPVLTNSVKTRGCWWNQRRRPLHNVLSTRSGRCPWARAHVLHNPKPTENVLPFNAA